MLHGCELILAKYIAWWIIQGNTKRQYLDNSKA